MPKMVKPERPEWGEALNIMAERWGNFNWQAGGQEEEESGDLCEKKVKKDMKLFLSDEEDEEDRVRWRLMIGSGHLKG